MICIINDTNQFCNALFENQVVIRGIVFSPVLYGSRLITTKMDRTALISEIGDLKHSQAKPGHIHSR